MPVIEGAGLPLSFSRWAPDMEMTEGAFGAQIPAVDDFYDFAIAVSKRRPHDSRISKPRIETSVRLVPNEHRREP